MSYSWDGRPSPYGAPAYGGSGDLDISRVFNDPRFAETVQASVRQVATMSGAFAHSSIDPRAIAPVPTLDTFPPRRSVYPGMVIRYRFAHDGIARQMWWDEAANSGAGAWVVMGPPLVSRVETGESTASTSFTDLATVGPRIELPAGGAYRVGFGCRATNTNTSFTRMGFEDGAGGSVPSARFQPTVPANNLVQGSEQGVEITPTSGPHVVTAKYVVTAGTGTYSQRWLSITPIELRPY